MATKSTKNKKTKPSTNRDSANAIDSRKALLAKVAGAVAAGLVTSPTPSIASSSTMAAAAVDIAEEILKKVGIVTTASSTKTLSEDLDGSDVGAA